MRVRSSHARSHYRLPVRTQVLCLRYHLCCSLRRHPGCCTNAGALVEGNVHAMDYLVVSENRTFLVSQHNGDMRPDVRGLGLFLGDTRHLSELHLLFDGREPELLDYGDLDVYRATILLGNPRFDVGDTVHPNTIGIRRERAIDGALYERITFNNYNAVAVSFDLTLRLAADFADIFIVRGFLGGEHAVPSAPESIDGGVRFPYHGRDDVTRTTTVRWSVAPTEADLSLDAGGGDPARLPSGYSTELYESFQP
jgi:glycogen debranching enzyme